MPPLLRGLPLPLRCRLPVCRVQTVLSDDQAKLGQLSGPAPRWLGNLLAWLLNLIGCVAAAAGGPARPDTCST